jgi:zinc finger protein 830
VNASQHKENLAIAKELKAKLQQPKPPKPTEDRVAGLKRSIEEMRSEVPEKRLKGILKNSSSSSATPSTTTIIVPKQKEDTKTEGDQTPKKSNSNSIPDDFFDGSKSKKPAETKQQQQQEVEKMELDSAIPEGFFDDPVKDAKARNLEYKDPDEEEWVKFQREIKDAEVESKNIINEDFVEATAERQIEEIDEQMKNWSRYWTFIFSFYPAFLMTSFFLAGSSRWKRRRSRST